MSNSAVLLIARILLSAIFISAGLQKLGSMPVVLAWASGIFEAVAGVAILLGFFTRYAAWLLAAFCVVTAIFFHFDFSDQMQIISLFKNLAIAGGFLALAVAGPGSISIDARRA
jgi:putative oxidoreductase